MVEKCSAANLGSKEQEKEPEMKGPGTRSTPPRHTSGDLLPPPLNGPLSYELISGFITPVDNCQGANPPCVILWRVLHS